MSDKNNAANASKNCNEGDDGGNTSSSALGMARCLLGKPIKCTLVDGRTVSGTFVCLDRL